MSDEPRMTVIGQLANGAPIRGDAGLVALLTRKHDYALDRDVCVVCGLTARQIVESGLRCVEVRHG